MGSVSQPTKQKKHTDLRHFDLQDWIENDLIQLDLIPTAQNHGDMMTKGLS